MTKEKICPQCGTNFTARWSKQYLCSKTCSFLQLRSGENRECSSSICNNTFYTSKSENRKYCNSKCKSDAMTGVKTVVRPKCLLDGCDNKVKTKVSRFCSSKCSGVFRHRERVQPWIDGEWDGNTKHGLSRSIRLYLLDESNWTCEAEGCGWNTPHPVLGYPQLEINHIDGNYRNNVRDNLEVLCLRCHGMTPNYKSLNKNGRTWRSEYRQFAFDESV